MINFTGVLSSEWNFSKVNFIWEEKIEEIGESQQETEFH